MSCARYHLAWYLLLAPSLFGTATAPVWGQPAPPALAPLPATPEQIAAWIQQLGADQFLDREAATENLFLAGSPVIEPLLRAIQQPLPVEARVRAVVVLKRLAVAGDELTEEQSRQALEQVAALRLGSPSQHAAQTLASLSALRQRRALEELVRLGAKTIPERTVQIEFVVGLEIGAEWRGEDHDLRRLKWLANLQQLILSGDKVSDASLVHVAPLPQLSVLMINRAAVTSAGLAPLGELKNLKLLEIKYVPVTDEAIGHLSKLATADTLRLYGTSISQEGAQQLKQLLPQVRIDHRLGAFLGIGGDPHPVGCLVTMVRPNSAAAQIGLQPGDVIVAYEGSRVGDFDGLTALISRNRPDDEVLVQFVRSANSRTLTDDRQADVPLGIVGKEHLLGCEVTAVAPGSFAGQLGIRAGEIVHRLNDEPVTGPAPLQQAFEQIAAGKPVSLDVAQRLDIKAARAKLGAWE